MSMSDGLGELSMMDLFRTEVEGQINTMTESLLALEQDPAAANRLEALMRAAHSIKGAARMVDVEPVIRVSHVMEDCFVAAQKHQVTFGSSDIDVLFQAIDLVSRLAKLTQGEGTEDAASQQPQVAAMVEALSAILTGESARGTVPASPAGGDTGTSAAKQASSGRKAVSHTTQAAIGPEEDEAECPAPVSQAVDSAVRGRVIRVSSDRMDKILGMAGEAMVESRWVRPYLDSMTRLKQQAHNAVLGLDNLRDLLEEHKVDSQSMSLLSNARRSISKCRQVLSERLQELANFDYRTSDLTERLHNEVISSRMRPFSDGVEGLQRMVRDLARSLGKEARLEISGPNTLVDRDVLEKIKTPLNHLLRNAVDHGIETPDEREQCSKSRQGLIKIEAYHRAGMLSISVQDDGRGIDLERLRSKVVSKGLATEEMAARLSEGELLEFMFLPGFSTRDTITEVSGRGVGMDVVQDVVREVRGVLSASTNLGKGTRIHMQLPLTLSVIRALLVEISDEFYAVPLVRVDRLLRVPKEYVEVLEDRQYITCDDQHVGLVSASQIFTDKQAQVPRDDLSIVIVSDRHARYGVVVDRFLGERELAVRVLDPRLGKIKDVSAAAFMDDGTPVLIIDVDDMVRSIDKLITGARLHKVQYDGAGAHLKRRKILVVDDSITVREVERKLLQASGYEVDVAVDGMDGWNAVRSEDYALVITDVDMPRMDGIELVRLIKQDQNLSKIPVMIVSYKDRDEDRRRGLDAGADYYLTKGSFHDDSLREAVFDLIGGN
jgi:two-component system sensor histidine kinase and response regulator WspE